MLGLDEIVRHLDSQHATLWGRAYDLGERNSKLELALLLQKTFDDILKQRAKDKNDDHQ